MELQRTLTLDINPDAKPLTVRVKQCDADSNVFTVTFKNSYTNSTVLVTDSQTVNFRCVKPSGAGCIYACTVNQDGTATFALSATATDEPGLTLADLTIEENGVILSTVSFWIEVRKSGISSNISGSNEYVELQEVIAVARELIRELQGGAIIECEDDGNGNVEIRFTAVNS